MMAAEQERKNRLGFDKGYDLAEETYKGQIKELRRDKAHLERVLAGKNKTLGNAQAALRKYIDKVAEANTVLRAFPIKHSGYSYDEVESLLGAVEKLLGELKA